MEDLTVSKVLNTSLGGFTVGHILSAILTLLVCLVVVRLVMKLVTRLLGRAQKLNERLQKIIRTAVKAVLYLLTAIITAGALGINTTSLTALMSVVTLGVTLAAEDILGNVAGGLVILSSHPFSIGDTMNHTKIEAYDGQTIMQPNKALSSSRVTNYTALGRRRIIHSVSASYDAPTETVKAACLEAVAAVPGVLSAPAPEVQLVNYGNSAIEYSVRCWASVADYWRVYFAVRENLRDAFARHGVEMTYDHLNVHVIEK